MKIHRGMKIPGTTMYGSGWKAIWTFIAVLAAVRTLGELFRHGWSDIVVLGLLCVAASSAFAVFAERRRASLGAGARSVPQARSATLRRREGDPILPGRRFF